jgi:hypothetical protein
VDKDQDLKYRGKVINVMRQARQGDPGFDASKNQVVVQYADKSEPDTEMVVEKGELSAA